MELNVEVLHAFNFNPNTITIQQIGSGHINRTYLICNQAQQSFILQNINTQVFKHPQSIAHNIKIVGQYLKYKHPNYLFIHPIASTKGEEMVFIHQEYWRLLPYIANSVALDTLTNTTQAYQAAKQFGKLSRLLNDFDANQLHETIPNFHNLSFRFEQFNQILAHTNTDLKNTATAEIEQALQHQDIVNTYEAIKNNPNFKNRVMHHDTKISNILLHKDTFEGLCVIDLDTLMAGKFISDLGDMMRTYLCGFSENETDLNKINIRLPYFEALIKGYLSEMKHILTEVEKQYILFSGKYIIYMQAIRFLTDYLNGDKYYPILYPNQNLNRAKNQFKLLHELIANQNTLQAIVNEKTNDIL